MHGDLEEEEEEGEPDTKTQLSASLHRESKKSEKNIPQTNFSLTLNTSEKNPAPIFSQLKSSRRARLDTALRRARYEDGLIRLVPWTLCMGGSASPSCSGSTLSSSIFISDAPGLGGGGRGGGGGRCEWFKIQPGYCLHFPCPSGRYEARGSGGAGGSLSLSLSLSLSGEGGMSNSRRGEKPNVAAVRAWILCSGLVSNKLRSCSAASCAVRLGEVPHGVRQRRLCRFLKCAGCCCCLDSLSLCLSLSLSLSFSVGFLNSAAAPAVVKGRGSPSSAPPI